MKRLTGWSVAWVVGVSSVAVAACAGSTESDLASTHAPILGGTVGSAGQFPTTVAIVNNGLCTGTLVEPNLVLTAAHCISTQTLGGTQSSITSQTRVVLDAENLLTGGGTQIQAAETIPHPSFNVNALGSHDVGLIRLTSPVTDRTPTPINRINADALPGIKVTQVGYGMSVVGQQNSAGTLFFLEDKVTTSCSPFGVSDSSLLCFSQTDGTGKCSGDSGGPSFATIKGIERVVGVTSFGDQQCRQFGADTRVDAELSFLFEHAPELACQADGDCNADCGSGGLPEDVDCAAACENNDDCDGERECIDNECKAPPFSPGGLGSVCENGTECDSGLCAMNSSGGTCVEVCSADSCPSGFDCIAAGDTNICFPAEGDDGGDCAVGSSSSGGDTGGSRSGGVIALLLVGLVALRRRK